MLFFYHASGGAMKNDPALKKTMDDDDGLTGTRPSRRSVVLGGHVRLA